MWQGSNRSCLFWGVTIENVAASEDLWQIMEIDKANFDDNVEEDYVMLDLDAVCSQIDIPPDEPYVLSKLDTANPVLTIGNKLKLIGEYVETMGTCLIFSENEKASLFHEERESMEANISKNNGTISSNLSIQAYQASNIPP